MNKQTAKYRMELDILRRRLEDLKMPEGESVNKPAFSMLLSAIPSYLKNFALFSFSLDKDMPVETVKEHLKQIGNMVDKESTARYLGNMLGFGSGRKYYDIWNFWNGTPSEEVDNLEGVPKKVFDEFEEFARPFKEVVDEKSLWAWDVGEAISIVKEAAHCGYIEEELGWQIIGDFCNVALKHYDNFIDYAISYIAGSCFFIYTETRDEISAEKMFWMTYKVVELLFNDENIAVWKKYAWYTDTNS